ncbi:MAG: N-acetylmuramoyl-L-alanine amidase [Akkermansia sp.]
MKICLDIGHCASSPGAQNDGTGITEFDFWKPRAVYIKTALAQMRHQVVIVNRQTDGGGVGMSACVKACNATKADVIVALHANAYNGTATGSEVIYWHSSSKASRLAACIQRRIVGVLELPNRGVKPIFEEAERGAAQLRKTIAPCVIVEPFFIDHDDDLERACHRSVNLCKAIAEGIDDYNF